MKIKNNFLSFFILSFSLVINAQGNNNIPWSVFDNGSGKQFNSSSRALSFIGQTVVGTSGNESTKISGGFLSGYLIRNEITSAEDDRMVQLPTQFKLNQNYPNPFNPSTIISWQLPTAVHVLLKIYDILGNELTTLVNEEKERGVYSVTFDASRLASGVYFYCIQAGRFNQIKKMILLR